MMHLGNGDMENCTTNAHLTEILNWCQHFNNQPTTSFWNCSSIIFLENKVL